MILVVIQEEKIVTVLPAICSVLHFECDPRRVVVELFVVAPMPFICGSTFEVV